MNGTPDLSYTYQWYLNNVSTGTDYYSNSIRVTSKGNYQLCVKITDPVKLCDTTICKTIYTDCITCNSFLPQIDVITMSDSCGKPGNSQFKGLVGRVKFKNPAAYNFYQIQWLVDSSLGSNSAYMRKQTSQGLRKVCVQIADTLNDCDTIICRNITVDCNINSLNLQKVSQLSLFPNPAKRVLELPELSSSFNYECYDASGRLVLQGHSEPGMPISIADINNGIYALRVWTGDRHYAARFVKQAD